jgi:hypothetical protein
MAENRKRTHQPTQVFLNVLNLKLLSKPFPSAVRTQRPPPPLRRDVSVAVTSLMSVPSERVGWLVDGDDEVEEEVIMQRVRRDCGLGILLRMTRGSLRLIVEG